MGRLPNTDIPHRATPYYIYYNLRKKARGKSKRVPFFASGATGW